MKRFSLLAAVFCCFAIEMFAVQAPTNLHWENGILKWDLPELTGDSVYVGVTVNLYTAADSVLIYNSAMNIASEYDFTSEMYNGRTYFATVQTFADPDRVGSQEVLSPSYTAPGTRDTLEVSNVTLSIDGSVRWDGFGYMLVRATLQKKNGNEWIDVTSQTTTFGWSTYISLGAISESGTYRAIADGMQGNDVVRRGISAELEIEEMYTVSFEAQSLFANPNNVSVAKNAPLILPSIPDQYKYWEDGSVFYWSTDVDGNNPWSFNDDTVTQDTTLYAQWASISLNLDWEEDTCKWIVEEKYRKVLDVKSINIYTEEGNFLFNSAFSYETDRYFAGIYFPGLKYFFSIQITDYYGNSIADTSALHTTSGEYAKISLENMQVSALPAYTSVSWDPVGYGMFLRRGQIFKWNKATNDWDEIAVKQDEDPTWNCTSLLFDTVLDDTEWYSIVCRLYQGEYLIYEGEVMYGNNPSTAIGNVQSDKVQCTKVLRDGQLFIEKNGRLYNAQGIYLRTASQK